MNDHRDARLTHVEKDIAALRRELDKQHKEFMQIIESACNLEPLVALIEEVVHSRDRKIADLERQLADARR